MYQVILSINNNNEEVAVLPAVPTDLGPQLPQNNGTYEGLSGDYNTLGPMGLLGDVHCQLLPRRPALQLHAGRRLTDGWKYVDFFEREPPQDAALPDHHSGWERCLPDEQPLLGGPIRVACQAERGYFLQPDAAGIPLHIRREVRDEPWERSTWMTTASCCAEGSTVTDITRTVSQPEARDELDALSVELTFTAVRNNNRDKYMHWYGIEPGRSCGW